MDQLTALSIIALAELHAKHEPFGSAGGGPRIVREAIDALGVHEEVFDATERFARSFLHCHFDTGINVNTWPGCKDWLDTVFVDFYLISLPGEW